MSESYKEFYSTYKSKLFKYLLFKSGDSEIAQDLVQESFTRHYRHYGQQSAFSPALLYTIARNALIDHQRFDLKQRKLKHPKSQITEDQESSFIAQEAASQIRRAVRKLSDKDQEILSLVISGVAYKEIAKLLDMSMSNVKIRIHRIRKRLQQMLADEVR